MSQYRSILLFSGVEVGKYYTVMYTRPAHWYIPVGHILNCVDGVYEIKFLESRPCDTTDWPHRDKVENVQKQ